jgi:hypothetical protein
MEVGMARRKSMTESEWLTCTQPQKLLKYLHTRADERKRRLFAAACCRRVWRLLVDERGRRAVEVAERYASGKATDEALSRAEMEADEAFGVLRDSGRDALLWAANAVYVAVCGGVGWDIAGTAASAAAAGVGADAAPGKQKAAREEEGCAQLALLRCVFGNPFRPVSLDTAWLTWNEGTVVRIAQAINDERAFERLGILADALEDAGCTEAQILEHLRGPGPHALGCWAIDCVLEKAEVRRAGGQ